MKYHGKNRRKKKLIEPRIQLTFAITFLATTAIAVLTQVVVQNYALTRLAAELPHDSLILSQNAPESLAWSCVITFLLLAPFTFSIGVILTLRIVGPIYRFRVYLTQLANGEHPGPCRIRESDSLQDMCELLNIATASLRRDSDDASAKEPEPVLTSDDLAEDPSEVRA